MFSFAWIWSSLAKTCAKSRQTPSAVQDTDGGGCVVAFDVVPTVPFTVDVAAVGFAVEAVVRLVLLFFAVVDIIGAIVGIIVEILLLLLVLDVV
jgi:hypothetical protein